MQCLLLLFLAAPISPVSSRGSISSSLITWSLLLSSLVALIGVGQLLSLTPSLPSSLRGIWKDFGVFCAEQAAFRASPHPAGNGWREVQCSWVIPSSIKAPFPRPCPPESFCSSRRLWDAAQGRERWWPCGDTEVTVPAQPGSQSTIPVLLSSQGLHQPIFCPVQSWRAEARCQGLLLYPVQLTPS